MSDLSKAPTTGAPPTIVPESARTWAGELKALFSLG